VSNIVFEGTLYKMKSIYDSPVKYYLSGEDDKPLNDYIGKHLEIEFLNSIECSGCKKEIKKSYQNGYCFPCTQKLAACDICILSPDRCHYSQGTCREPNWGQEHCMIPHYVYLSNTSGIKVGLTRHTQIPTRWIDQGAVQAKKIIKTFSRHQAGVIEKIFSKSLSDRTSWQSMLKKTIDGVDFEEIVSDILRNHKRDLHAISRSFSTPFEFLYDEDTLDIEYPYNIEPESFKSKKLDKEPLLSGTLLGIKGQYLIFDNMVINIRSHTGYKVSIRHN
jgi:hypothetical protein